MFIMLSLIKKSFPVDTCIRVPYDVVMLHYSAQNLVNKLLTAKNISGNNEICPHAKPL
ncbi:hypothetical protein GCM10022209_43320 [Chitinophaga oryziterrae]